VIAYNKRTERVVAVGTEAYRMEGRAPEHIAVVHPLQDGVISDDILTQALIREFISAAAGPAIIASLDGREVFVTGHCEYDRLTLASEYERDTKRGLNPAVPRNYFPGDDPTAVPPMTWCSHAHLLFSNWLNYFVYQQTPYDIELIETL